MFGLAKSIKRVFGFNAKNTDQKPESEDAADTFKQSSNKLSNMVNGFFSKTAQEFRVIMEKSKDLSTTNYNLGMKYLNEGNLKEAIFRFKITKKFWPDNYDAHYQLIVCLILDNKLVKARQITNQLLEKAPHFQERITELNIRRHKEEFENSKNSNPASN
jgi:tetratricopeptide (TPR) repeat protein